MHRCKIAPTPSHAPTSCAKQTDDHTPHKSSPEGLLWPRPSRDTLHAAFGEFAPHAVPIWKKSPLRVGQQSIVPRTSDRRKPHTAFRELHLKTTQRITDRADKRLHHHDLFNIRFSSNRHKLIDTMTKPHLASVMRPRPRHTVRPGLSQPTAPGRLGLRLLGDEMKQQPRFQRRQRTCLQAQIFIMHQYCQGPAPTIRWILNGKSRMIQFPHPRHFIIRDRSSPHPRVESHSSR